MAKEDFYDYDADVIYTPLPSTNRACYLVLNEKTKETTLVSTEEFKDKDDIQELIMIKQCKDYLDGFDITDCGMEEGYNNPKSLMWLVIKSLSDDKKKKVWF